ISLLASRDQFPLEPPPPELPPPELPPELPPLPPEAPPLEPPLPAPAPELAPPGLLTPLLFEPLVPTLLLSVPLPLVVPPPGVVPVLVWLLVQLAWFAAEPEQSAPLSVGVLFD